MIKKKLKSDISIFFLISKKSSTDGLPKIKGRSGLIKSDWIYFLFDPIKKFFESKLVLAINLVFFIWIFIFEG